MNNNSKNAAAPIQRDDGCDGSRQSRSVILAVDVGSSSVRCAAYAYEDEDDDDSVRITQVRGGACTAAAAAAAMGNSAACCRNSVNVLASSQQPRRSVHPGTGRILLYDSDTPRGDGGGGGGGGNSNGNMLLDVIDACVDDVLQQLHGLSLSLSQNNNVDHTLLCEQQQQPESNYDDGTNCNNNKNEKVVALFTVTAIGFSTFCMNLVGVDRHGTPVGDAATLSYACGAAGSSGAASEVNAEVEHLKRQLGEERLQQLYRKTGAPMHAAYALAQLRVWYKQQQQQQQNNDEGLSTATTTTTTPTLTGQTPYTIETAAAAAAENVIVVHKWQTIASACLCRWTGLTSLPISYSEASWTGLLNVHTCRYEPGMLELLPRDCCAALPALADYNDYYNDCNEIPATATATATAAAAAGVSTTSTTDHTTHVPPASDNMPQELRIPRNIPAAHLSSSSLSSGAMMMDDGHSTTDTRIGMTTKKNPYYQRWPALRDARLFLGLGDGACANLGSKCSIPTRIACTVGTSAAARICLPLPMMRRRRCCNNDNEDDDDDAANASFSLVEPGLFCYRIDRFHVLVGGALTDGGSVVEWLADLLNRPVSSDSFQECLRQAETLLDESYYNYEASSSSSSLASSVRRTAPPPLTVVPFFSGERSTGFRTGATGAMLGLTLETTPAHVLKACLEGVTLRINAIVQLIQKAIRVKTGTTTKTLQSGAALVGNDDERLRIICSGKALEVNALWRQMLADCTGLDVVMDEQTQEGTSRGVVVLLAAALLAAASNGGGGGDDIREDGRSTPMTGYDGGMAVEHIDDSNTSVPRKNARGYWNQASLSQESLIEAVSPFYSR